MPVRIVFAGTPEAALPTLNALVASSHEVVGVITRPPARSGRGRTLVPSPVASRAAELGIDLYETSSLKSDEAHERIAHWKADIAVVVAYGALIPLRILNMLPHGWLNLHFSNLPEFRGAAPVQWAILSGCEETASCVFQLEEGLDTGPVFSRLPIAIADQTSGELLEEMAVAGSRQVVAVVDSIDLGSAHSQPQIVDPTVELHYARRLEVTDGAVSFTDSARQTWQQIRAVIPSPGAFTLLNGQRLKLGKASLTDIPTPGPGRLIVSKKSVLVGCADFCLELGEVAPAGKKWMEAAAWARGARLNDDDRLGEGLEH